MPCHRKDLKTLGSGEHNIWVEVRAGQIDQRKMPAWKLSVLKFSLCYSSLKCSLSINIGAWEAAINFTSRLTGSKTQLGKQPPGRLTTKALREKAGEGGDFLKDIWRVVPTALTRNILNALGVKNHWKLQPTCPGEHFRKIAFDI